MSDSSSETVEAKKQWDNIFTALKEKRCQSRMLFPTTLSFKNEIKILTDTQKQRIFF